VWPHAPVDKKLQKKIQPFGDGCRLGFRITDDSNGIILKSMWVGVIYKPPTGNETNHSRKSCCKQWESIQLDNPSKPTRKYQIIWNATL